MTEKVSTTIYMRLDHLKLLNDLSKKTRVPYSVYVREAVTDFLRKRGIV